MPLIKLNDIDDPHLQVYRHLKKTNLTRWSGQFIAEGKKLVTQLLESEFEVESVLTSDKFIDLLAPFMTGRRADVPVYAVPHHQAQMLVGQTFHAGMLGCGLRREPPRLDDLIVRDRRHLFVACQATQNQDNIGSIIRSASAFGATAVLLGSGCCDPFSRKALRISMGSSLFLPIIEAGSELRALFDRLRTEFDSKLIATVLDGNAETLRDVETPGNVVILLGNEDAGLSPEWIELCDRRVTIPMQDGADSLNVSVAAGIFLHHFS